MNQNFSSSSSSSSNNNLHMNINAYNNMSDQSMSVDSGGKNDQTFSFMMPPQGAGFSDSWI